jgi:uncharacterized membrane protein
MKQKKVLLVGETWISRAIHIKGFDEFSSTTFHNGAVDFLAAVRNRGVSIDQLPAHEVPASFPRTHAELQAYSVIILSDIGSNSLLLSNATWLESAEGPNAIDALNMWVKSGGALLMVGGYLSFQGFQAIANFANTSIGEVLPVEIQMGDDRVESPQGYQMEFCAEHEITKSLRESLETKKNAIPLLLGYNRTKLAADSQVLLSINSDPLVAIREVGLGRSAVWTSDIGPHWCPQPFIKWNGYELLMGNLLKWLSKEETK